MTTFVRSFDLLDISIRSGGDGRTVEAYAAVFDTPTEIVDRQGHYREQIARTAFAKTISDRGTRFGVLYNHGMTLHGTPSDMGSVPIGVPVEAPRADAKGLVTVSRYNRSALADSVLESIRNGDITGQSFSGRWIASTPASPRGGYRAASDGALQLVTRTEIAMSEYGPTPIPAYDVPMVVGVRNRAERAGQLAQVRRHFTRATLTADESTSLAFLLSMLAGADASIDPIVSALCSADMALDAAQMVVSAMLAVPDPDLDEVDEADTTAVMSSGRRPGTGTPAAALEPLVHSGGLTPANRAATARILRSA